MQYPRMNRTNMRYRGPIETEKANRQTLDVASDLSSLYKNIELLDKRMNEYRDRVYKGTEVIQGVGNYSARLNRVALQIQNFKRGVENV